MASNSKLDPESKALQTQKYIAYMIAKGEQPETIQSLWEDYVADLKTRGSNDDIAELLMKVLSDACLQMNKDLQVWVTRTKLLSEMHQQLGGEIEKLASLRQGIDGEIKKYEEKLNSIGDDVQLANTDLQNTLQKQQQTLQNMSNTSKMLNDTALAVIRKIGG